MAELPISALLQDSTVRVTELAVTMKQGGQRRLLHPFDEVVSILNVVSAVTVTQPLVAVLLPAATAVRKASRRSRLPCSGWCSPDS
jgi:hypothetical protein